MRVGVIADTHGQLRPEAVTALRDCALILHAGDIGRAQVLEQLRDVALRVVAVRGNVDSGAWSAGIPDRAEIEVAGRRRFKLPVTVARLEVSATRLDAEIVPLAV